MTEFPQFDSGLAVRVFMPLFKIAESMCNNFKGYKYIVMSVQEIREMLQVQGQTMQVDKQGLLNAIIVKVKDTWLDEEQLAFLADPGITDCHDVQPTIIHNAAFQIDDLDAYDSDCYDISSAKAVLMANLTNYSSDVLSKAADQDTNSFVQQDSMILYVIEQMSEQMVNHITNWEKG
ncbi:hypothetical protein Tco_1353149 [Tanacetum coccineum]